MTISEKKFDIGMIIAIFSLILYGFIVIYSGSKAMSGDSFFDNLAFKQFLFTIIVSIIAIFIIMIDFKFIFDISWIFYFFALSFLVAIFYLGKSSHGAQRWIALGPVALQPSEFAKLAIILALARFMSNNIQNKRNFAFIVLSSIIVIIPLILILKQPDLGTSLTLIPILTGMLFMAGIKKRYFIMLFPFALIPLMIIYFAKIELIGVDDIRNLLFFLKPYQQNRILAFIDPNIDPQGISYNLIQSQIAIGSGGLNGLGFLKGKQTHLKFLPESHTDFAFSVLGEEWGFLGGILLLLIYYYILRKGLIIAEECTDYFPKLASIGIVILLLFHIITNIGMTIGIMPITGLPLPLISYGGSSLLTTMISLSLLMNFQLNSDKIIFR